ncbi:uncharacterized protein si:dkey-28a3.2 isoform X2 [Electrophorus electricus]|uniref:uncharacterized protein si:dkey-28a3.2 isoform X2 n=1 Tax=Electrophorus electricus TaxID=8005 RepID=UPI0015D0BF3D|nr:uncharacterized protein si:dkey-28a3.2 isoform X2 [Electrophorus electricus]
MSKTKTLSRQRYRPVSEFDEVTLACKREYWRTKKREQRARLSLAKKTPRAPKTGSYRSVFTVPSLTDKHVSDIPHSNFHPALLSTNGSYQTEESNVDGTIIKLNGVPLTKDLPVAAAPKQHRVHLSNTETRQTQNKFSTFNDKLSGISQPGPVPQVTPEYSRIEKPQIKNCAPPRSLAFGEYKVHKDLRSLGGKGANTNRKACVYVPECSTGLHRTVKVPMSEEEKAAKRRESWRIKKREQRAKRAEKLKKDRERMQCFSKGQQDTGKHSRLAPARSLFSVNTMASKGAKQHNSVMSVDLILSDGKPVHFTVKMESDILSSPKQQSGDTQGPVTKNFSPVLATRANHLQGTKPNNISMHSGVSQQTLSTAQVTNQSKRLQHKFIRNQKRHSILQGDNKVETAAERHAKQREYWRIKKREQRARLSAEAKARLKERAAMRRRSESCRGVLEQTQATRTSFQHRVPQAKNSTLASASETISGFIREDGTLTVPTTGTSAEILLPARSCSSSAVKSSSLAGPSVSQSQKLVSAGSRSAVHVFPYNTNSSVNIHQRSTGQKISTVEPLVRSKLASSTTNPEILKGLTETIQVEKEDRMTRTELGSCGPSSAVTPSIISAAHDTIKQEPSYPSIDSVYSLSNQDLNINIKPSPSPSSETMAEIGDSQATTLLVVASMKKLLEESLSSVVDSNTFSMGEEVLQSCKTEKRPCHQEETDKDISLIHSPLCVEVERDFSGDTKPAFEIKQSPVLCLPPPQAQVPDFSAQSPVLLHMDSSVLLPSAGTAPAESSCFGQGSEGERAKLPMAAGTRPLQRRTQGCRGETTGPLQCHPPEARGGQQLNESSELQRKREYWRLMKRQQRARKAKEKERSKDTMLHKQPSQSVKRKCDNSHTYQPAVARSVSHTRFDSCAIPATVTSAPSHLVLSSTTSATQQSSNGGRQLFLEAEQAKRISTEAPQVKQWQLQVQGGAPTPPPRPNAVTFTQMNRAKFPGPQAQTRGPFMTKLKNNQSHFKAISNQELDADELVRRKRMHWRIKKQEQRARKAARERELSQERAHNLLGPTSSNVSELTQRTPLDRMDFLPEQCQTMSFKEAELCFSPADDCSDEPVSEVKWRSAYLMDYDPVHQLLVCMVCGQQQYALSVEGARAHIEEAHPGTLALDERERQRILTAWDEQVAVRERFFTSQLWQHGCSLKGKSEEPTAEVEVILDPDDLKQASM